MQRILLLFFLILCSMTRLSGQPVPDYATRSAFLFAPPAAFDAGLLGFSNPANLVLLAKPELRFLWTTDDAGLRSLQNWGAFGGLKYVGVAVQRQKFDGLGVTDFKISTAFGSRSLALGLGYGWSAGKQNALGREKILSLGLISRPSRFLSLGLTGNLSLESSQREGIAEVGLRPLGTPKFTLFADAALQKGVDLEDAPWSVGAAVRVLAGVNVLGRYFKSEAFTLGLTVDFGRKGAGGQAHFDPDSRHVANTFFVRSGGERASFVKAPAKGKRYVPLSLRGRIDYLKYRYFDGGGERLMDVLQDIESAISDERVRAIALNLSAMRVRPEHGWEIREQLRKAQQAGKKIIIFLERAGMTGYHLASVADYIAIDPLGALQLPGYALSRTYFKGTLSKLGLGFEEWRFFKYKSANETFSRDSMSQADREQTQAFVDDWYELTRSEVCRSRNLTHAEFDSLIDVESFFQAEEALAAGLVDTLARWSEIDGVIRTVTGTGAKPLASQHLLAHSLPQEIWGPQPRIAVVYGLGVCAMDEGIKARWLQRVFEGLAESQSVKAVVFRVDSPGGDGMASDVVAEAIKKCRQNKPVIISQGQVAASGGYWLSMYGDAIVAGPNTVTGSIGVIFGWVYDSGFGEKLGMTSDLVKRGEHADLGLGIRIPFTGLQVPARNLNAEERRKAERTIRQHYDHFVKKVAAGRSMPEARVREIAEGRIYSGLDGKALGLVDEIGGLFTAIGLAREKAGLKPGQQVELLEIPKDKGFFNLSAPFSPVGVATREDPVITFLQLIGEHTGTPLPVLVPGTYPE